MIVGSHNELVKIRVVGLVDSGNGKGIIHRLALRKEGIRPIPWCSGIYIYVS